MVRIPMSQTCQFPRYLTVLLATIAALMGSAFTLNCLTDPLWYCGGNRISEINYIFDERVSKINLINKALDKYDSIVFGSSRSTTLDASKIEGHSCFNLSFAAGGVEEFVAYAKYLKERGFSPNLIIVGVDGFNFSPDRPKSTIPEFIQKNDAPPSILKSYFSIDALVFSYKIIRDPVPQRRYYDRSFSSDIITKTGQYQPDILKSDAIAARITLDAIDYYQKLLQVFPDANFVAYVPPISAWRVGRQYALGNLDSYLEAIYMTSRIFKRFYDFSIPSEVTSDTTLTCDGSHYTRETNDRIARILNGAPQEFGLALHDLSWDAYRQSFTEATESFLRNEQNLRQQHTEHSQTATQN
jgi:hypothetical protein